ncbi:hypothetical protein CV770_18605 [Bradyrhizobium sp. AC87j1]|nr:hypothetical protein CV770_18605 [Bradyrhizobium sp. AC87j1]
MRGADMAHRFLALYRLLSRPYPESTRRLLHHLRIKPLPKKFDIVQNALTVFGLQVAQDFLCPLGTFTIQGPNALLTPSPRFMSSS